jgi:hypothetical protein
MSSETVTDILEEIVPVGTRGKRLVSSTWLAAATRLI